MAAKEKEYRSLPGRGVRRHALASATRSRLWLGKDHLLATDAQWYTEEYKRFYFRDIQAVIIRKTDTGKVINAIFGALTLLTLIAAVTTSDGFSIFWWCVAGFFGLVVLINTIFGPTCFTHIRTAVQSEELPSLRRLRRANKVLARLRPLITAAQGELPPRTEQVARTDAPPLIAEPIPMMATVEAASQPPPETPPAG
jgi:hypothetical protein